MVGEATGPPEVLKFSKGVLVILHNFLKKKNFFTLM